jgi:CheY-like chemotaxis protein
MSNNFRYNCGSMGRIMFLSTAVDVVVVDKYLEAAEVLASVMMYHGYTASAFGRGADALTRIRRSRPHLVVTEFKLSDMTGLDVLDAVRTIDASYRPAIALLTAYYDSEDYLRHGTGRFTFEIGKPMKPHQLDQLLVLLAAKTHRCS